MRGLFAAAAAGAITLRPYQVGAAEAVLKAWADGQQRVLIVLPTGTGKTTVFAHLIGERDRQGYPGSMMIAHREELLEQGASRIESQNPHLWVDIEAGGRKAAREADVVVAGVATVGRVGSSRLEWFRPNTIICDEAHHAAADSYTTAFQRFGAYGGSAKLLGVTATPQRLDNRPLHGEDVAVFEDLVYSYGLLDAIRDGWLVDLRGYRVETGVSLAGVKKIAGDYNQHQLADTVNKAERTDLAYKMWADVARDRRTIVFCASVQHASDVADFWRGQGFVAESVDGSMGSEDRRAIIERFRTGQTQVLTNCQIATEGFDVPEIGCVLMLKPTMSWALYAQMVGRGTRLAPGKTDCIVIDVADLSANYSLASVPGMIGAPKVSMKGHTLCELAKKLENADDQQQALMAYKAVDFDEIDAALREVDLFTVTLPLEIASDASMAWFTRREGCYALSLGDRGQAHLDSDTLGRWRLILGDAAWDLDARADAEAVREAETLLRRHAPNEASKLGDLRAPWRKAPATDKQIALLRRKGVPEERIKGITKGDAATMLNNLFAKAPKR